MVVSKEDLEELLEETVDRLIKQIQSQEAFVLYPTIYEAYERIIKVIAKRAVFIGRQLNEMP